MSNQPTVGATGKPVFGCVSILWIVCSPEDNPPISRDDFITVTREKEITRSGLPNPLHQVFVFGATKQLLSDLINAVEMPVGMAMEEAAPKSRTNPKGIIAILLFAVISTSESIR